MLSEPSASPARWIDVTPERFPGWIESFGGRHGAVRVADEPGDAEPGGAVVFVAADGAVARVHAPFPPVPGLAAAREPGDRDPLVHLRIGVISELHTNLFPRPLRQTRTIEDAGPLSAPHIRHTALT